MLLWVNSVPFIKHKAFLLDCLFQSGNDWNIFFSFFNMPGDGSSYFLVSLWVSLYLGTLAMVLWGWGWVYKLAVGLLTRSWGELDLWQLRKYKRKLREQFPKRYINNKQEETYNTETKYIEEFLYCRLYEWQMWKQRFWYNWWVFG